MGNDNFYFFRIKDTKGKLICLDLLIKFVIFMALF